MIYKDWTEQLIYAVLSSLYKSFNYSSKLIYDVDLTTLTFSKKSGFEAFK